LEQRTHVSPRSGIQSHTRTN